MITLHTKNLYKQLKIDIRNSSMIYILSSFLMESGINVIFDDLQYALSEGADIKVLTGDYLYVTDPKALEKLLLLEGDNIEIRLWQSDGVSFHPKSFIFKHKKNGALIVGSSNLSRSALIHGVEWNLRMERNASIETFDEAIYQYIEQFYAPETMEINAETIKLYKNKYDEFHASNADLLTNWTKQEEIELTLPSPEEVTGTLVKEEATPYRTEIRPRQAQVEALKALEQTIEEGYSKAMVVMATGLGKTFLAALFAKRFKRILFIAHRQEILKQAKESFELVLQKRGGLLYGFEKDIKHDMIFASIFTLSIQEHLHEFERDHFDLIVVDEFHHAAAKSYERVMNYFEPEFLIGLTATPERTDGKDVFALCDGNVAYEINFIQAIQRGWLSPFTYYGIKDDIDYSEIRWLGNRYDQKELLIQQLNEERATYIFQKWMEYRQTRTIGFCSSIQQAQFLTDYFNRQGVRANSLTSESSNSDRALTIEKLSLNEIDIIFTVDLFNEGVDIPSVDTLLFVRPTESMVVYTQQLGRGLRKSKETGKERCVIIDLIGNYRSADMKLQVFNKQKEKRKAKDIVPIVPDTCEIYIETEVINLIKEMRRKRSPRKERMYHDYISVKHLLGRRPTYDEMYLHGKENVKEFRQVFGGYFSFLKQYGELSQKEEEVFTKHYKWLDKLEKESMTKSYKMVVLQYLLEKGPDKWFESVTPEEVAPYFHRFYMSETHRKQIDFSNKNNRKLWDYDEKGVAKLIATMPMKKWVGDDDLIVFENNIFQINFPIDSEDREILHEMTRQICEFKLNNYFRKKGYEKL